MDFYKQDYQKYNTASITIKNAVFVLKGCEILKVDGTKYGYQKVIVKLSERKVIKMKTIEEGVNDYLEREGHDKVRLVYGNKVYAKKKTSTPEKELNRIKLTSVYISNENKTFAQLWMM